MRGADEECGFPTMRGADEECGFLLPTIARPRTGIEYYDFCIFRDEAGGGHLFRDDNSAATLGRGVDAAGRGETERRGADFTFARGERAAIALLDRPQRPAIAE